jgi:hypothetical protein
MTKKHLTGGRRDRSPARKERKPMIQTDDLWQTAYLLSEGYWLDKLEVRNQEGHRQFTFTVGGLGVDDRAKYYRNGAATCNVRKLRVHMNHLKDLMFGGVNAA